LSLAQVDTGGISGVVTDCADAVIPGVPVRIVQENTSVRTGLSTTTSGFYAASNTPARFWKLSTRRTAMASHIAT